MPNKLLTLCTAFIATLLLVACDNPTATTTAEMPENFDLGTVKEGHYHNDYFDLDIYFDPTWNVQEKEQMERLQKVGQDLMVGDNKELEAMIDASDVNSAYLLSVFKHPLGAAVEYNPNFIAMVENLRLFPGIKTGEDYLFNVKKLLDQTAMKFEYGELMEKRVGTKIFHILPVETTYMGVLTKQHYLCTVERGFCLSFILSFSSENEQEELYEIVDKVRI